MKVPPAPHAGAPAGLRVGAKAGLLLVLLALGTGIGALGHAVSGHQAWYLAIPGVLVLGWWRVADPTRCAHERRERDGPLH